MKLRRALSYATLGIGAAAVSNAAIRRDAGDLPPALDGLQRTYRWRGMNVAYTEAGDPDDPGLVLLHGLNAAGSSGEWRAVFDALAEEYHVVAPDLPGFGRSDRPPIRYSAALYESFVESFLGEFGGDGEADVDDESDVDGEADVDDEADVDNETEGGDDSDDADAMAADGPAVIASSLSASYAVAAARNVDVSRFVLICPTATTGPGGRTWVRELFRTPLVGEALFNVVSSKPAIRYFNADHGYADPDGPEAEWQEYEWLTAHQERARFAPAAFLAGDLDSELDLGGALADLDVPTTLVWGRETELTPVSQGEELARAVGTELLVFDRAKLLPHVERADAFLEYVLAGELPDDHSVIREYDPGEGEPEVDEPAEDVRAEDAGEREDAGDAGENEDSGDDETEDSATWNGDDEDEE